MPEPIPILFGRQIRRRRESAGLSQEALADSAGITRNYVGMIERGEANPTLIVLHDLAAALGVSMRAVVSELETQIAEES